MIVGFEAEMYTVTESQELVELSITIIDPPSEGALRPFTLLLDTNNGSAGSQSDYESVTDAIYFTPGDTRINYTINITDDAICESPSEEFYCSVSLLNGDSHTIVVQNNSITIIILDTEEPECAKTVAASPGVLATTGTMFTEQENTADSSSSATTIGVVLAVIFLITTIVATATVVAIIFLRRQQSKCPLIISKTVHDSKEEKADEINTASNEAYEVLKQRGMPEESKEKTTEGAVYEVIPGEN